MNNKIIKFFDENSLGTNTDNIIQVKLKTKNDFNEILDTDIQLQKIVESLILMEKSENYYEWYNLLKEKLEEPNNFKDFHKAFLYERLWDFIWQLGDYSSTLNAYNESKKYWNKFVYEKILNLYTSFSLVDENMNFSEDNNIEFLLWECKNACEYNLEAYSTYGYYTYLYKQDIQNAKKILKEWIEKWSKTSLFKYIELNRNLFLLELWNIEDKKEKIAYIEENKWDIEIAYRDTINLGETKLIWELGSFYEEIWLYLNAKELYELHIKTNNDYTYYKNLGDLYSSWNLILLKKDFIDKSKIESYENLYEKAFLNRDVDNYIYWLNRLLEIYVEKRNINKATDYYNTLYQFRNWNDLNTIKESSLLLIKKLYEHDMERMDKIFSELKLIDYKYLLLEASYYEDKDKSKTLDSYLKAYLFSMNLDADNEWIYDSGNALGIFLYTLSLAENIQDNKNFLEDMAEKAYNYDTLLDNEIITIMELLK